MKTKAKGEKTNRQKAMLGLPDLEHAKSAVLVSLRSPESQLSYRRSIDFFVRWYCSERRNLNMSLFLSSGVKENRKILLCKKSGGNSRIVHFQGKNAG